MNRQQTMNWDEEMQERVFGARPMDDYNFKTRTFPKYSEDAAAARELVQAVNRSGRYRIGVNRADDEWAVEVTSADAGERLALVRGVDEAATIVNAIVTADVQL